MKARVALLLLALLWAPPVHATTSEWFGSYLTSANTGSTRFAVPWGNTIAVVSAETSAYAPVPASGTVQNLYVQLSAAPGAAASGKKYVITLMVETVASSLTCQVLETATSCNLTGTPVSVTAGNRLSIRVAPTSTPNAANVSWSLEFVSTSANVTALAGTSTNALSTTTTQFSSFYSATVSTAENLGRAIVSPGTGCLQDMYTYLNTATGAGTTRTFTLRVNGLDTAVTTTYSNAGGLSSSTGTCIPIYPGDQITVGSTLTGSPAASIASWGIVYSPNVDGDFIIPATSLATNYSTSVVNFSPLMGMAAPNATETNVQTAVQANFSITRMQVRTSTNLGGATKAYTCALSVNTSASGTFTVTLTDGLRVGFATGTLTPSANDLLATSCTPANTPTAMNAAISYLGHIASGGAGAGVAAQTANLNINAETSTAGTALTAAIAQSGTQGSLGGGAWTATAISKFKVGSTDCGVTPQSMSTRNVSTTDSGGTRSWVYDHSANPDETLTYQSIGWPLASLGACLTTTFTGATGGAYDLLVFSGPRGGGTTSCVLQLTDGPVTYPAGANLRAHTSDSVGSSQFGSYILIAAGTTYWVSSQFDGINGLCSLSVYNKSTGAVVGTSSAAMPTGGVANVLTIGSNNHGTFSANTTTYDQILVDWDSAVYPLSAPLTGFLNTLLLLGIGK